VLPPGELELLLHPIADATAMHDSAAMYVQMPGFRRWFTEASSNENCTGIAVSI